MTLNAKIDGFMDFAATQSYIIHKVAPRYWRWWRGVVDNAFRLKRSYSTPGPVSTAMGDCLRVGTAIGFRASREHYLKFFVFKVSKFVAFDERSKSKSVSASVGLCPLSPLTRGSAPGPRWGLAPRPIIGPHTFILGPTTL